MSPANPFARIVVGFDDSHAAELALRQSALFAEQYAGEIVAVNVSDTSAASVLPVRTRAGAAAIDQVPVLASLDGYRRELFDRLSRCVAACPVPVRMEFSMNEAAAGILDAAIRWKATAIALGTHGRTGIAHVLIGSVAESVLRNARVPVIVTRAPAVRDSLREVVVGIDASDPSANASAFAVEIGSGQRVRLCYCTVVDTQSIKQPYADVSFDPTPILSDLHLAARNALDAALQNANSAGVYPDTEIADAVNADTGLCDIARRHAADAIVVGNHKRGGFERFFLGSTAEALIRQADRPVIVVPARDDPPCAAS